MDRKQEEMPRVAAKRVHSRLETVPLEILDTIFSMVCYDILDLRLLCTSKTLSWKLRGHPILQALGSFCSSEELFDLFGFSLDSSTSVNQNQDPQGELMAFGALATTSAPKHLRKAYSIPGVLKCVQIVMLKRIVLQAWTPFLHRDGIEESDMSTQLLQKFLDCIAPQDIKTARFAAQEDIMVTDSKSRYSWTRLHVLPLETRVVIRDQLFNTKIEKDIPLLQEIWC